MKAHPALAPGRVAVITGAASGIGRAPLRFASLAMKLCLADFPAGAIIGTGSKQGITCPPGDTANNVSRTGAKMLAEALAHSLRNGEGNRIRTHLLIPGSPLTGIARPQRGAAGCVDARTSSSTCWWTAWREAISTSSVPTMK